MHTLLDLHRKFLTLLHIFDKKLHDVNILDLLPLEAGAFYIMDRAYLDFERFYRMNLCGCFFVLRVKSNTKPHRLRSNSIDNIIGLVCNQVVKENGINSKTRYPKNCVKLNFMTLKQEKYLHF